MKIKVYATLRDIVGSSSIHIDSPLEVTVEHLLQKILAVHPDLGTEIFNDEGQLRSSYHIIVNGRNVRFLKGLETLVTPDDTIHIFPPVGGGSL